MATRLLGQPRARALGVSRLILTLQQHLGYGDLCANQGPPIAGMGSLAAMRASRRNCSGRSGWGGGRVWAGGGGISAAVGPRPPTLADRTRPVRRRPGPSPDGPQWARPPSPPTGRARNRPRTRGRCCRARAGRSGVAPPQARTRPASRSFVPVATGHAHPQVFPQIRRRPPVDSHGLRRFPHREARAAHPDGSIDSTVHEGGLTARPRRR